MPKKSCDVLIVGGGLVGLSLAKGLEDLNISYYLVDDGFAKPSTKAWVRALALSKSSLAILRHLGIHLSEQDTSPIQKIQVSCQQAWGKLYLEEPKHEYLGLVVNLLALQEKLLAALRSEHLLAGSFTAYCAQTQVTTIALGAQTCEIEAKLVIAADGAFSAVRQACSLSAEFGKEQTAVLSFLALSKPHQGLAFERFTAQGPLALLPWQADRYAMIWGMDAHAAESLVDQGAAGLEREIKKQFGSYLTHLQHCSPPQTHPLSQIFMPKQHYQSILFLGNAAHTLHPVAGQGFNLSLRDVAVLLDTMVQYGIGPALIPIYLLNRQEDQRLTQQMTRFLSSGMQTMAKHFSQLTGLGMHVLEQVPGGVSWLGFYAQGLGCPLPAWVYENMES